VNKQSIFTLCSVALVTVLSANTALTFANNTHDSHFVNVSNDIQYDPNLAKCTNIQYCDKKTQLGKEYFRYVVKCSDGKKREITAWEQRTKWCVGVSNDCYKTQKEAADAACKQ